MEGRQTTSSPAERGQASGSSTPPLLRVLVVDDSRMFLDRAASFIASDPRVDLVARANSAGDAMEMVKNFQPHLVLMDLKMPGMNGLEATRQITALPQAPRVIITTMYNDRVFRVAAHDVGAAGFITKMNFSSELMLLINNLYPDLRQRQSTKR